MYSLKPWYCQRAQFSLNVSIGRGRVALRSRTSSCLFNSYKSYITKRLRVRSRYATIFDTTDTASLSQWSKSVLIHTFLQINKYMQTIERGRGNKLIVQSVTVWMSTITLITSLTVSCAIPASALTRNLEGLKHSVGSTARRFTKYLSYVHIVARR